MTSRPVWGAESMVLIGKINSFTGARCGQSSRRADFHLFGQNLIFGIMSESPVTCPEQCQVL